MASTEPYVHLSPVEVVEAIGGSVFWSPRMELVWAAAVWLLGLGGLALAVVVLRHRRRSPVAWGTLAAAALAVVVGWTQLVPAPVFVLASPSRAIAYEPVCAQRSLPICLHPAYETVLAETADLVDAVVRPLVGLPGFPTHAEQVRPDREGVAIGAFEFGAVVAAPDVLAILPADPEEEDVVEAAYVAIAAVTEQADWFLGDLTPAQSALAHWLIDQTGWDWGDRRLAEGILMPSISDARTDEEAAAPQPLKDAVTSGTLAPEDADGLLAEIRLAADRFGALSPEAQRAWLEANFAALRAGTLTLEEMP
jgi:hypothetical protein